jgi:uncharacterized protein YjbJ (UPF0337 family)
LAHGRDLNQQKEAHMNWTIVEGKWAQLTGNLKSTWGKFTDSDITQLSGKRDNLVGLVQERYGVAKDDAEKQVDIWAHKATATTGAAGSSILDSAKEGAYAIAEDAKKTAHTIGDAVADVANSAADALVHASKATAKYVANKTSK